MPIKYEKRGRNRLNKRPSDNTIIRRSERAYADFKANKHISTHILERDIKQRVVLAESKLALTPRHQHRKNSVEIWRNRLAEVKKAKKKQKTDKFFGTAAVKDFGFDTKHLYDVVQHLKTGQAHKQFTLLPTERASTNPGVFPVVNLKDGTTLCIYRHAIQEEK